MHDKRDHEKGHMGIVYLKARKNKSTRGDMLKWKKRFMVASSIDRELQLFKNDQALVPKDKIPLSMVVSTSASGKDKAAILDIAIKGGRTYTMKMTGEDSRDKWVKVINDLVGERPERHESAGRHITDELRSQLSGVLGYEIKLHFDNVALSNLPPDEYQKCLTAIHQGTCMENLFSVFRQLAAVSHAARTINKVIIRSQIIEPTPYFTTFDKISGILTVRVVRNSQANTLKVPDPSTMLPLLIKSSWQRAIEEALDDNAQWRAGVKKLHSLFGTTFPVVIDWGSEVQDTQALQTYVARRLTGRLIDSVADIVQKCLSSKHSDDCDLSVWVSGMSFFIGGTVMELDRTPLIRMHRAHARHDEDLPEALCKAEVNLFLKCSGADGKDALLCDTTLSDLGQDLTRVMEHIQMVQVIRSTEKLAVGVGNQMLEFVINWESFITTLIHLGTSVSARLKLAKALRDQYPSRVDGVISSLTDTEWGILCGSIQRVVARFVAPSSTNKTTIQQTSLIDVCILERHERSQGTGYTSVLSFDVKDLGCYCRGLIAALRLEKVNLSSSGVFSQKSHGRTESNDSSSTSDGPEMRSSLRQLHDEPTDNLPTQYAEDSTLMSDMQLPEAIQSQLQTTNYNTLYPISSELLTATIKALNQKFSTQGVIAANDKLNIIVHAVTKLRSIFYLLDTDKKGLIKSADVSQVVSKFQEYKSSQSSTISPALINEIGEGLVSFEKVAMVLMTKLFPSDVQKSLMCRRHCLLLGLDDTGKSTLVNLLKHRSSEPHETTPTIGHHTEVVKIGGLLLSMHEVGGRLSERRSWSMYSKDVNSIHGVVFMVDGTKPSTFELSRTYLKEVLHSKHLRRTPLLLIINNSDSHACVDKNEVLNALKLEKYCKEGKRDYRAFTTHILSGEDTPHAVVNNLQNCLKWLVDFQSSGRKSDTSSPSVKRNH